MITQIILMLTPVVSWVCMSRYGRRRHEGGLLSCPWCGSSLLYGQPEEHGDVCLFGPPPWEKRENGTTVTRSQQFLDRGRHVDSEKSRY